MKSRAYEGARSQSVRAGVCFSLLRKQPPHSNLPDVSAEVDGASIETIAVQKGRFPSASGSHTEGHVDKSGLDVSFHGAISYSPPCRG